MGSTRAHRSDSPTPDMDGLSRGSVQQLRRGQHACLLYGRHEDPLAVVAPFAAVAFQEGERCLFVVGELDPARIERSLAAAGVDVALQVRRKALVLVSRWEVSFPNGEFDPAAMIGFVRQAIAQTLVDGFTGLRVVAEMTWALQLGVGANKLIHYEALGNHLYPDQPLVAVCMYDRSRFPAAVCHDALRVHPWVAVGESTYDNVYYEPPEAVIDGAAAEARVQWMLGQLQRLRDAEQHRLELLSAWAAKAQAEAALRAKEATLSMLAHELRTPLASLLFYTQATLRRLDKGDTVDAESLRRNLDLLSRQAGKQARLIDRILEADRFPSGQMPLALEPCDLAGLVREVAEVSQAVAPEFTVAVQASAPVQTLIDPVRIEQVLVNLIDNARKYSPAGTRIDISVLPDPEAIRVSVRDHGRGIPEEERERIFERFHRLARDENGGGLGLGLGLHISREIVRRHGGDLLVEAPEDGGSRFVMRLPRQ